MEIENEINTKWNDIDNITLQRKCIAHLDGLGFNEYTDDSTVQRKCISSFLIEYQKPKNWDMRPMRHWLEIFERCNPKIILYTRADGYRYCKIAPEDIDLMARIVNVMYL